MKTGDLVRFKVVRPGLFGGKESDYIWMIGLLIKYETWEKVGTILYEGKLLRIRAENIQKAGKKDVNP